MAPPAPPLLDLLPGALAAFDPVRIAGAPAVVGFDGFVDEMAGVVASRRPDGTPEMVPTIADFGAMVSAAAGKSFGREVRVKSVEPGGNAPNLAGGLASLGLAIDYYGTLGDPLDPVFEPFAARCRSCTTLGPCGRTLALEFADGKLMLNNTARLAEFTPAVMERALEDLGLRERARAAPLIGLANWSRYPHMTECWRLLHDHALVHTTHRPWVMIDLADPTGRSTEDLHALFELIRAMSATCRVVFGANLAEGAVLLRALGHDAPTPEDASMLAAASRLRDSLGVHMTAIHSQTRAAGAWETGSAVILGAHNPSPVRTTGVGDRFNAGLVAALLAGVDPRHALALGCAAGAWFVTTGRELGVPDFGALPGRLAPLA